MLRRLSSKCISKAVRSETFEVLTPLQVGVGVQAGCESIFHAISLVQEDSNISPELKWTLLDFSNAFNNVTRESMFQEVRARIPSMSAWLEMYYGAQPLLQFGDYTILSCSGVQQGDPLGPLGFALALHPLVEKINEQVPGLVINAWYLDDGTLCGSARNLQAALTIIEGEGPALGLHLNRAKSLLYIPEGASPATNPLPPDIPTTSEGFVLLGSPIVSPSFSESVILRRVNKVETALSRLPDLLDSQMETTLLRSCLSLPKVAFALRTCPPEYIANASKVFYSAIRASLSDITGCPLPDWSWEKATLPSSLGGLNLRLASIHAPAAFIGSLIRCQDLISRVLGQTPIESSHLQSTFLALVHNTTRPNWFTLWRT